MQNKAKIGIIGATGYAGEELTRLILTHPAAELCAVASKSYEGKVISDLYPSLRGICDMTLCDAKTAIEKSDVVFACLPHGLSQETAAKCDAAGKIFIDLGADFRLESESDYKEWYGGKFDDADLHKKAVYAIPELFRDEIKKTRLIANPGCYPTTAALGLFPALKAGFVKSEGIIIDSKSGVTGAGRGLSQTTHYPDCNEAFSPYKIAVHRHTPEIEQTLSKASGSKITLTFVPHLLPVNRGIVSTIYARLNGDADYDKIYGYYADFYKNEQFVRLQPKGEVANLKNVRCSNYCDISLHLDKRAGLLIVVSTIDNMVKGAAGQAVQNMNILLGIPENTGLLFVPPAF